MVLVFGHQSLGDFKGGPPLGERVARNEVRAQGETSPYYILAHKIRFNRRESVELSGIDINPAGKGCVVFAGSQNTAVANKRTTRLKNDFRNIITKVFLNVARNFCLIVLRLITMFGVSKSLEKSRKRWL